MPFAAHLRRTAVRAWLAAASVALPLLPSRADAGFGKPHIEGLALGMSAADLMRASRRPCGFQAFSPTIPGIRCIVPGQPDVGVAAALTRSTQPARVFALILNFCSRRSFPDLVGDVQSRYGVALDRTSTMSDASRGGSIGRDLLLVLSRTGVCASRQARFALMIGDPHAFASETATPQNLADRAPDAP